MRNVICSSCWMTVAVILILWECLSGIVQCQEPPRLAADWVVRLERGVDEIKTRHLDPPSRAALLERAAQRAFEAGEVQRPRELPPPPVANALPADWTAWLTEQLKLVRLSSAVEQPVLERRLFRQLARELSTDGAIHRIDQSQVFLESGFGGIGASLTLDEIGDASQGPLLAMIPGGPAERAGLQTGERIAMVNGQSLANKTSEECVALLRGKPGSNVTLEVISRDSTETREVTFARELIHVTPVIANKRSPAGRLFTVVSFRSLNSHSTAALKELDQQLAGGESQGVILDFRNVRCRDMAAVIELGHALLGEGEFGRLQTRNGVQNYFADQEALFEDLSLAVLLNAETSPEAAWLAVGLQHVRGALLAGPVVKYPELLVENWQVPDDEWMVRFPVGRLVPAGFPAPDGPPQLGRLQGEGAAGQTWSVSPDVVLAPLDIWDDYRMLLLERGNAANPGMQVLPGNGDDVRRRIDPEFAALEGLDLKLGTSGK